MELSTPKQGLLFLDVTRIIDHFGCFSVSDSKCSALSIVSSGVGRRNLYHNIIPPIKCILEIELISMNVLSNLEAIPL